MKYPKICSIGDPIIKNLFQGEVFVEEKIDGSQFRVWFDEKGTMFCGSKSINYSDEEPPDKLFLQAIKSAENHLVGKGLKDTFLIFEYLKVAKQNTLSYSRIPKDNLILLDCMINGNYISYEEKVKFGETIDFEVVPLLKKGEVKNAEEFNELLKTESCLGGSVIEGVVVKNYNQFHSLPYLLGMPVFGKFVRKEFKELNDKEWKVGIPIEERLIEQFPKEPRWVKAVQHLKEKGILLSSPKDIGKLLEEINRDVEEECSDIIKDLLWKEYKFKILRQFKHGFAEWYKQKLMEESFT